MGQLHTKHEQLPLNKLKEEGHEKYLGVHPELPNPHNPSDLPESGKERQQLGGQQNQHHYSQNDASPLEQPAHHPSKFQHMQDIQQLQKQSIEEEPLRKEQGIQFQKQQQEDQLHHLQLQLQLQRQREIKQQLQHQLNQQKKIRLQLQQQLKYQQEQHQKRTSPRKPPRIPQYSLHASSLLTDQSNYVRLGDNVGSVIALGDFTADRYSDLLVVLNTDRLRCITVLPWNHHSFSFFQMDSSTKNVSTPVFCIDSIPNIASDAVIASASTLDSNGDGLLDVMLIIRKSPNKHFAALLLGDGAGVFTYDQTLPGVTPFALIMDANDDMRSDIFFISSKHERIFYINNPSGIFTKQIWRPFPSSNFSSPSNHSCLPTFPFNSNAFVDIDGDCTPDLVVTTTCGMELWLNEPANTSASNAWPNGHFYPKPMFYFHQLQIPHNEHSFLLLNKTVWDSKNGDSHAVFADFNADGAIDIAVFNSGYRTLRISYGVRQSHVNRMLCARDGPVRFLTRTALTDVEASTVDFGATLVPPMIRTGDFNFDGLIDLMFVDADSGTVSLFKAAVAHEERPNWLGRAAWPRTSSYVERMWFSLTGLDGEPAPRNTKVVTFLRYVESPILHHVEDPLAAAFFDTDESGRQDIIISQRHGTRLIWNNYEKMDDVVYFKATGVNAAPPTGLNLRYGQGLQKGSSLLNSQPFSPLPGNTFKLSYVGRHRRETQICSQCSQSSVLTLQSCSCLFGITRIANYIEEMAMGGAGGVQSWMSLMPNALAMVWPQRPTTPGGSVKWKVSYLSKGRDGQMKGIVLVLFITLAILLVAIIYIHNLERSNNDSEKFDFGYT